MLPSVRQLRILYVILSTAVLLAYLSPNFWYAKVGGFGAALLRDDEYSYSARILRVQQGNYHVGNPWSFEHRNEISLIPALPEWVLGTLSILIPIDFEGKILFLRALLVLFLFFACSKFFEQQAQSKFLGVLLTSWILTDPGLIFYKPLITAFSANAFLPLNRFTNPLFGLSVFFLTLYLVYKAFDKVAEQKWAVLAGIALATQFYVSVYYWSHACLWIFVWSFLSPSPKKFRQLILGICTTLILVIPYIWNSLEMREHPVFSTMAWRNGLLLKDRGWYLLGHKTIYLFILLSFWKLFSKNSNLRFLSAGVVTGSAIYFSPLVIGISFQNFHWHYTLAPISFALLLLSLPPKILAQKSLLLVGCLASVTLGLFASKKEFDTAVQNNKVGLVLLEKEYEDAFSWIKEHTESDAVVLTSHLTSPHIPLRTQRRVFYNTIVEFVPAHEVLQYYQMFWYLHGWKDEELFSKIFHQSPLLAQIEHGFTKEQEQRFRDQGFPPISVQHMNENAKEVSSLQSQITAKDLKSFHQAKRIDYLIIGPNEIGWKDRVDELFQTEKVFQGKTTEVYKVIGWTN